MNEKLDNKVTAYWTIYSINRNGSYKIYGPKKNRIVLTSKENICGNLINDYRFSGGLKYLEVGEGLLSWGVSPPSPASSTTALEAPLKRYQPFYKGFIDALGGSPSTSPTDTCRLMFMLDFDDTDVNGYDIREFAIFGGEAIEATLGSGHMFNVFRDAPKAKTDINRLIIKVDIQAGDPV